MSEADFHAVWCNHRGTGEPHDDVMPYCMRQLHGIDGIAAPGEKVQPTLWVYATSAAHPNALASGERAEDDGRFDGVELTIEKQIDGQFFEQTIRLRSDAARTLAATLIRAADIQQGLTR